MKKLILSFSALLSIAAFTQPSTDIPTEVKPFVLEGFEILDYKAGDINGDKKADGILILRQAGEDTTMDETARPMLLLIRQADGKLKQVARNDNAIMCRQCGGVFGDPYEGTDIYAKGFTISFYGGSSWRWAYHYEFVYKPEKKNWFLVKETQSSFQAGDPEKTMKDTEIGSVELGEISFEKFGSEAGYEDSKWKVTAVKTFFYDNPRLGSKSRKAYLLKGNMVTGIRQFTNFIEVSFENTKGTITTGFILRKDLASVK